MLRRITFRRSETSLLELHGQLLTRDRYGSLLGCGHINLQNTTDYYARYTTSLICNGVVQNSKTPCKLTGAATRPLCADSCVRYLELASMPPFLANATTQAELANSEGLIVSTKQLCPNPGSNYIEQI